MRSLPYTWRVGVDNAFGYLTLPDGKAHLVESRRFLSGDGLAIRLDDGSTVLTAADGASRWQPIPPARACELAGIPAPEIDGEAETARRLDPFHVERHTSAVFNVLVAVATARRLPCAHALRAWSADTWNGTFDGPYFEQPETFAASVLERAAFSRASLAAALAVQLASDAMLDPAGPDCHRLMAATGWQAALEEIPGRVAQTARLIEQRRQSRQDAARANSTQLALL